MAREHARIWLDINDDDHFEKLSPLAQWLYVRVLLTDSTLNYCGVADWRPKRLLRKAAGLTIDAILGAAAELEQKNYTLFDLDTEEVLVRSYIRRDELLRNPKMAATVIKAYPAVASGVLRAAVVTELRRVHKEHVDYSSWTHKDTAEGLARLLGKTPLEEVGYTPQISVPNPVENGIPNPIPNTYPNPVENGNPNPVENTDPDPDADHQSQSARNPSTSTLHPSPAPLEGYVSPVGHQGDEPDPTAPRPSDRCPRHANVESPPACRACGGARLRAQAWDHVREAHDAAQVAEKRRARTECLDCDEAGWVLDDEGQTAQPARKCNHGARSDDA